MEWNKLFYENRYCFNLKTRASEFYEINAVEKSTEIFLQFYELLPDDDTTLSCKKWDWYKNYNASTKVS